MKFDNQLFLNPPMKNRPYRLVHSWTQSNWNFNKSDTVEGKVDYLEKAGFGGIVTNVEWNDNYLKSDEDFAILNKALDRATQLGMGIWIYDEHLFPSGSARTLTCEGHPELEAIGAGVYTISGSGECETEVDIPEHMTQVLSATLFPEHMTDITQGQTVSLTHLQGKKLRCKGIEGNWLLKICGVYPVFTNGVFMMARDGERKYPNLLNREAVAQFIKVTYEEYKNRIPDFSQRVEAFFTDEPSLATTRFFDTRCTVPDYPLVPWEASLPERFMEKFEYDLLPYIPCLFEGDTPTDRRVRQNFYELVGDLMKESFSDQINDWCAKNGAKFSGHLLSEENFGTQIALCGDMMKVMDGMGYPGVDILDMLPKHFPHQLFVIKMAQGSAKNNNKKKIMAELCPVPGWAPTFYSNHHEYALGFMGLAYLSGINHSNLYYAPDSASFEQCKMYNDYVARLQYMLEGAVMNSSIGLFYPTQTAQQYFIPSDRQVMYETNEKVLEIDCAVKSIAYQLTTQKLDYTMLTEAYIEMGKMENGWLNINGNKYNTIILPRAEVVPERIMQKLDEFAKQGGQLIFTHCLPKVSDRMEENEGLPGLVLKYKKDLIFEGDTAKVTDLAEHAVITVTNDEGSILTANPLCWSGKPTAVFEVDMGTPKAFDCVTIYMKSRCDMGAFSVDYLEGDEWVNIAAIPSNTETIRAYNWTRIIAQKIRITVKEGSIKEREFARIEKIEVYNSQEATGEEFLRRIRNAYNARLRICEDNPADEGKLMLSPYLKEGTTFYMLANMDGNPVSFTIKDADAEKFNIYNPYDGSLKQCGTKLTIQGFRALFIEPLQ